MPLKKATEAVANEKLGQARRERRWSQGYVAGEIGTTLISVNRWERGITFPSAHFRKKLCQLYGKTEMELGLAREHMERSKEHAPREASGEREPLPRSLWHVPYTPSPFFTGRASTLQDLHDKLRTNHAKISTVAISGLGGIGKTLIALEYAYRHQRDYNAVFWANAEDAQTLAADFEKLAGKDVLNLAEKDEQNQDLIVTAVKRWLSTHHGWLLILDNVEDLSVVAPFLPLTGYGSVLLTTRDQASGEIIDDQVKVDTMELEDAVVLLLRRARILLKDASLDTVDDRDRKDVQAIAAVLDYLPLALDQAGAYIEETQCGLSAYLDLYEKHHHPLLERRGRLAIRYRETVTTTWSISFHKVERANSLSADLLRLFAFLHANAIPEELMTACLQESGLLTQHADAALAFNQALEELMKYSLVKRNANDRILSIHRLVQTVL